MGSETAQAIRLHAVPHIPLAAILAAFGGDVAVAAEHDADWVEIAPAPASPHEALDRLVMSQPRSLVVECIGDAAFRLRPGAA